MCFFQVALRLNSSTYMWKYHLYIWGRKASRLCKISQSLEVRISDRYLPLSPLKVMPEPCYLPYSFRGKWNQKPSYGDFYCVEVFFCQIWVLKGISLQGVLAGTLRFFFNFHLELGKKKKKLSWDPLLYNQFASTLPALVFNLNQGKTMSYWEGNSI